ncbi:MAG: hypothetical protein IPM46_09590 [Flavobacteriales bacterium]|nr:hypothetical protein [Flavobacteriales bacterium]
MALNAAGDPVVAYGDVATQTVIAQRWNGSGWTMLGGGPLSVTNSSSAAVAMDAHASVVVYMDGSVGGKPTVKRWNGLAWELIGLPGFTAAFAQLPQLVLDDDDAPIVAYHDGANGPGANASLERGGVGACWRQRLHLAAELRCGTLGRPQLHWSHRSRLSHSGTVCACLR